MVFRVALRKSFALGWGVDHGSWGCFITGHAEGDGIQRGQWLLSSQRHKGARTWSLILAGCSSCSAKWLSLCSRAESRPGSLPSLLQLKSPPFLDPACRTLFLILGSYFVSFSKVFCKWKIPAGPSSSKCLLLVLLLGGRKVDKKAWGCSKLLGAGRALRETWLGRARVGKRKVTAVW